jgi:hypothetical protein
MNDTRVPTDILETQVPARESEGATRLRLNAPGQRGILHSLVQVKRSAGRALNTFGKVQKRNHAALEKKKSLAKHVRMFEKAMGKTRHYLNNLLLLPEDVKSIKQRVELTKRAAIAIEKATTAHREKQTNLENLAKELKESITHTNEVAREFQQELKRIETVAESWMDVKWTTDNATSVGRGPPGHIAYNPMVQYRLPYEVSDVTRVIEEANKRVR